MRSERASQAAIGAAAHELHLPTIRAEATRLSEIAARGHVSHLGFLAEVLSAEVDDRIDRRRTRRINEAKFPRLKRLADFNVEAVPAIGAATSGHLATGGYMDAGEPIVLVGGLLGGSHKTGRNSGGEAGPGGTPFEGASFLCGLPSPDSGILAVLDGPRQTGVNDLAPMADEFRLLDLAKSGAGVPSREEQLGVFVHACSVVTPSHTLASH